MDYTIKSDVAHYVIDELTGEPVSPPLPTRERAWEIKTAIEALPAEERAKLRAGARPAPGCDWLLPREVRS